MKTIHSFRNLEEYGINPLTGESCRYSQRLLCDVNEDGKRLLEEFLAVSLTSPNWNSTVNGKPAVASVMLPYDMLQSIATFVLCHVEKCFKIIYHTGGAVCGVSREEFEKYSDLWKDFPMRTNFAYSDQDARGSRNVHQMSGRSH